MNADRFIACGMYAFTDELQQAWQDLFDRFHPDTRIQLRRELDFTHSEKRLRDSNLFIGQTCGYPLMTHLRDALSPFCVALFDVPGTDGKLYSSNIIVSTDSDINSLGECRGKIVAINTTDSNSGMNLLRYALAKLGANPGFFSKVQITGGHLQSLTAVAEGRAQVAAIDCVTFQLIADQWPQQVSKVRSIGFTAKTCGLPFVMPKNQFSPAVNTHYTEALNQAISEISPESRARLHLNRFEKISIDDYKCILEIESFAINNGYAQLN